MKKFALLFVLLFVVIVLLPIIGNKVAQSILDEKIEILKSNGIEVVENKSDSSYLQTKKHYEFLLSDASKFLEYLNKFSNNKIPPYANILLDGVRIGIDLEYSNFPLAKELSIDVYPLTLSSTIQSDLQEKDADFYTHIKTFLENHGVLYHINYNIATSDFNGYLKDIKEEYSLKNGSRTVVNLSNAIFNGKGDLIAPSEFVSSVEQMMLQIYDANDAFTFNMQNFNSKSIFESQTTYISSAKVERVEMSLRGKSTDNFELNASKMGLNMSANTQGVKAEFYSKANIESLVMRSNILNFKASNFNYDVALNDVDKDSLEKLRVGVSKLKSDSTVELLEEVQESAIALLSRGMVFDIADFSIANIVIDDVKDLEGLSIKSRVTLKEDMSLKQKIQYAPIMIIQSLNIDTKLQLSHALFEAIVQTMPMISLAKAYAKEDANTLSFDIRFMDGAFKINDKAIKF
ncbi:MAG: hypothetical protein WC656_04730 [Sulfurimonas sp.]|jgi:hypothetical protein